MLKLFREINKVIKENGSHDSAVMKEDFDFEFVSIEFSMNGFKVVISKEDNKEVYDISFSGETKPYGNYIKNVEEKDVIYKILSIVK
jgi:hypothetical protein